MGSRFMLQPFYHFTVSVAHLNKNWRLRLDTSIVSRSMTWICLKPVSAKSFSSSQPSPPAPTTRIYGAQAHVAHITLTSEKSADLVAITPYS